MLSIYFNVESFSNRNNWGHKGNVSLYDSTGVFDAYAEQKIVYYNRTWEKYQYQSLLYRLHDALKTSIWERIKTREDVTRLTKDKKNALIEKYKDIFTCLDKIEKQIEDAHSSSECNHFEFENGKTYIVKQLTSFENVEL